MVKKYLYLRLIVHSMESLSSWFRLSSESNMSFIGEIMSSNCNIQT